MTRTLARAWNAMGDRDLGNPKNYFPIVPSTLVGGVQIGSNTLDPFVSAGYFIANGLGLFVCLLIGYWLYRCRRNSVRVLPPSIVIAYAMVIGAIKAASTGFLLLVFQIEGDFAGAFFSRLPRAVAVSVLIVLMISMLFALQKIFVTDGQLLLARRVSKEQVSFVIEKLQSLEKTLKQVKYQIQRDTTKATKLLQHYLDSKIKPLSRELWAREAKKIKRFDNQEIIQKALFTEPYPPVVLTLILLVITPGLYRIIFEFDAELLTLGVQIILYISVIVLLNRIKRLRNKPLILCVSGLIITGYSYCFAFLIPQLILGQAPPNAIYTFVFLLIFTVNVSVIAAAITYFLRTGTEQTRALIQEEQELFLASKQELDELYVGRELAGALHGRVQNQILISLTNIQSGRSLHQELDAIMESIMSLREQVTGSGTMQTQDLIEAWSAFLNLELDIRGTLTKVHSRIIEEAISNAFRHGKAGWVSVYVSEDSRAIRVDDDGFGPLEGKSGLGSLIYSSSGDWTLKPREDGGSTFSMILRD